MKTIISEEQIQEAVSSLAEKLNKKFQGTKEDIVAICILNGALFFYVDLMRKLKIPVLCDTLGISSYEKDQSTGKIHLTKKPKISLHKKQVLIVEDIVDTGRSLEFLIKEISTQNPQSITTVALIQRHPLSKVDFSCFKLDKKKFLVGYGLDYSEKYRTLKEIKEI